MHRYIADNIPQKPVDQTQLAFKHNRLKGTFLEYYLNLSLRRGQNNFYQALLKQAEQLQVEVKSQHDIFSS